MRKYKHVEFQFDPEIERTGKRLRKGNKNSKGDIAMDDLQHMGNFNLHGKIQPVNGQEG